VNRQLNRLAVVAMVLLGALIVATTYWQAWAAGDLKAKQDNAIQRVVQFTIARGKILGADGKVIFAANKKQKRNGNTLYFRRYPQGGLASQTLGYSTASRSQAGLEESMNDYLTGSNTDLSNAFHNLLHRLGQATVHGDNLQLTIRPKAQALAQRLLGDRCGAVVAMNPKTGAVYVMASSPTYDPNEVEATGGYGGTGLGSGTFTSAAGRSIIPDLTTDFIYSALAQELGLIGVAALLMLYMVFVLRGFRVSLFAGDGFSKLLAAGLTFCFALQTFIIVGGILRLIPLTGITLPLVSYGGSSIVANFLVLAGLMLVSNRANAAVAGS